MISAKTQLYAIYGNPVKHSQSPTIQNAAFEANKIDAIYLAFNPKSLKAGVDAAKNLEIKGLSITIPYKQEIIPYLDQLDPLAQKIGAVNTVKNVDGKLLGYNTDGLGAAKSLENAGCKLINEKILILGNGGAARAIAFTLLEMQANITICGRNLEKTKNLCSDLKKYSPKSSFITFEDLSPNYCRQFNIIINTTPVGMEPQIESSPYPADCFQKGQTVFDIIYAPQMTKFLQDAQQKKCNLVFGKEMLLYQGAKQFEIWTEKKAPVDAMKKVLK